MFREFSSRSAFYYSILSVLSIFCNRLAVGWGEWGWLLDFNILLLSYGFYSCSVSLPYGTKMGLVCSVWL